MQRLLLLLAALPILVVTVPIPTWADDPPRFEWKDGDRVVLIGDALIEREQKYGYLETLITAQNPDKTITFRNLGWSGDTVRGIARAGFGTPEAGYRHLTEHVLALKPTVILVGYGMSDSFAGEDGRKAFAEGLNTLLDVLAETRARIVLLSPIKHEDLGRPLPDPAEHNRDLQFYCIEIAGAAGRRHLIAIDLYHIERSSAAKPAPPLSDDGIHPNAYGYWIIAQAINKEFRGDWNRLAAWFSDPHNNSSLICANRRVHVQRSEQGCRFEVAECNLPVPNPPIPPDVDDWRPAQRVLGMADLPQGRYVLKVDGKPLTTARASEWAKGVLLTSNPEGDQVERLRQAIIEKNRLYFYRWRPQNETYLFGFRKHEQGKNAREIPLFDPLVEEKEKEIARLRVPVSHVYELVREGEEAK